MKKPKHLKLTLIIVAILPLLVLLIESLLFPHLIKNSIADLLFNSGDYANAQDIYQKLNARADMDSIATANIAKTLYKQGSYPAALDSLKILERQSELGSDILYDLGNIAFQLERYQDALNYYKRALLQNPADYDLKANYELALRKLNQQNPPPPPPQDGKDNEEDDQEPDPARQEDLRNILEGLDQKESRDRQNQQQNREGSSGKWW